jgi:flagellar biosynthesis/type III secretory pathway protein FliH
MSKHQKFVFEELSKAAVVNSTIYSDDPVTQEIINNAVVTHLSNIVEAPDKTADPSLSTENSVEINAADNLVDELVKEKNEPDVNIEDIRKEEYEKAMADAKAMYEPLIAEGKKEKNFSDLLNAKLGSIVPEVDLEFQIATVSSEAISAIAKKLHLILPVNFDEILTKGMIEKLKTFYKEGQITLIINPLRYETCVELLKSDSIPSKFKDNFQILKDESIAPDDCKIEWNDTCLEYNQEQLSLEIDKIIEQLRSTK